MNSGFFRGTLRGLERVKKQTAISQGKGICHVANGRRQVISLMDKRGPHRFYGEERYLAVCEGSRDDFSLGKQLGDAVLNVRSARTWLSTDTYVMKSPMQNS